MSAAYSGQQPCASDKKKLPVVFRLGTIRDGWGSYARQADDNKLALAHVQIIVRQAFHPIPHVIT